MSMLLQYDQQELYTRLAHLPARRQVLFALCCAERLYGAYRRYSRYATGADASIVRIALDRLWLGELTAPESEQMAESILALVPEDDALSSENAVLAQNGVTAVAYALLCRAQESPENAMWAGVQCYEAVDYIVHTRERLPFVSPGSTDRILVNPLVQDEIRYQERILSRLAEAVSSEGDLAASLRSTLTDAEANWSMRLGR